MFLDVHCSLIDVILECQAEEKILTVGNGAPFVLGPSFCLGGFQLTQAHRPGEQLAWR